MYDKGGNMLHTIRQLVNDDDKWRGVLRGLQRTFGRQTVTGAQVREYLSRETGLDLRRVFEQYLERPQLPVLEYRIAGDSLSYRWLDVVPLFDMPVRVRLAPGSFDTIRPSSRWQTVRHRLATAEQFAVDENFYVVTRNADAPASTGAPQP
jgi:aminopeptidase N